VLVGLVSLQVPLIVSAVDAEFDIAFVANTEVFCLAMLPEVLVMLVLLVATAVFLVFVPLVVAKLSAPYEASRTLSAPERSRSWRQRLWRQLL
jgi:hypothetical protein